MNICGENLTTFESVKSSSLYFEFVLTNLYMVYLPYLSIANSYFVLA